MKMMDVFKKLYVTPGMCLSVERAVELDRQTNVQSSFSPDVYRQPVLTETFAEPQRRQSSQSTSSPTVLEMTDEKVV